MVLIPVLGRHKVRTLQEGLEGGLNRRHRRVPPSAAEEVVLCDSDRTSGLVESHDQGVGPIQRPRLRCDPI